jgi:hypothetical protein
MSRHKILLERNLTNEEINQLVTSLRNRIQQIDCSLLEAYFDIVKNKNFIDLRIPWGESGWYYFHVSTGWVISFVRKQPSIDIYRRRLCTKVYFRNFIASVYDSMKKGEDFDYSQVKSLKKYGYRTIMCLRKSDDKAVLIGIARHISVLQQPSIISSFRTKVALNKSKFIAHKLNMSYPNIYKLDKLLKSVILSNEQVYYRQIKKLISLHNQIYTP